MSAGNPQTAPANGGKRAEKSGQMKRTRERVLAATAELISETGYSGITIEQIARRSGVARSTIYRHWDNLPEIAMAAFRRSLGTGLDIPDTGSVREDLVLYYQALAKQLQTGAWRTVVPAMLQARLQDQLFAALLFTWTDRWRNELAAILDAGAARGEIPPVDNIHDVLDPVVGGIYYRLLFTNRPRTDAATVRAWVDRAVNSISC